MSNYGLALRRSAPVTLAIHGLVALVAIVGGLIIWQAKQARDQQALVQHSVTAQSSLEDLGIALRDAETGQRGYLLTGRPEYLAPYEAALQRLPSLEDKLSQLSASNVRNQRQLATLSTLVRQKLAELAQTVQLRTDVGEAAAKRVVLDNTGQQLMVRITAGLDAMLAEDNRLLAEHFQAAERTQVLVGRLSILGSAMAFLSLAAGGVMLRRAMARLHESETGFRLVTEHASDIVSRVGPDGNRTYVSPAAVRILGVQPERLLGQGLLELTHPDDRPVVKAAMGRVLAGEIEQDKAVFRVRRADGAEIWVEGTARGLHNPQTGATDGYIALLHDITEHKRAESRLRESEARYRLLANSTNDVIMSLNLDLTRTYVSPACRTVLGYQPEEMVDTVPASTVHPDDKDTIYQRLRGLTSGETDRDQATYRMRHRNGHWVWIEALASLVRDEATGQPSSITCTLRDISDRVANTELDRMARQLTWARDTAEKANRAKSRFLASMSHELRTPLNGIMGYTQLLRLEGGLNVVQSARVDAMLNAGTHLLEMINRVLSFSEIEVERPKLEASEIDLEETVHACLDMVRPMAEAKRLALSLTVAADAPRRIITDPGRLRQLVLNLVGNAVKFTDQGSVEVNVQAGEGAGVRVEIADTGPGIPAERRHRLFQDFERLDDNAHNEVEGAGLGLALSARLAALMDGRLGYEDKPGGGSVFWLELPLAPRTIAASPPATTPASDVVGVQPVLAPTRPLRVLVVDDVAMNRDIALSFLSAAGHEVTCAEGGADAVAAVATTDFDVVLMDVRMPEMDGLEATRRIRAHEGVRGRVPVVALTAQTFAEQVDLCRKAGMDGHLAKPFSPDALLGAVVRAAVAGQAGGNADVAVTEASPAEVGSGKRASPLVASTPVPVAPELTAVSSDLPILDLGAFERTSGFLTPQTVASHLQTLAGRGEALLCGMRVSGALTHADPLAAAAHALAGSAGMFGFERLASIARRFERAVETNTAEVPVVAESLTAAIEASLEEMKRRMPVAAVSTPNPDARSLADAPV